MSGNAPATLGRRHLLVVTGATAASAACSDLPDTATRFADASASGDVSSPPPSDVKSAPPDVDQPFVDIDGGIQLPQRQPGWRSPCGGIDVGAVEDFPLGVWRLNPGARALITRDARGLYAFSALCTHEQCVVNEPDASGTTECVCHGSRFDGNGRVMRGPAVTALRRFSVSVTGGRVCVDPATRVAEDFRAVIPDPDAGVLDAGPRDVPRTDGPTDTGPVDTGPRDTGVDVDLCSRGVNVGPVTMFAVGTWTLLRMRGLIIGRDARGLFAYSALCTHQGCVVNSVDAMTGVSICTCHSSRFDGQGQPTAGPAREPLPFYPVRVCAGNVVVDQSGFATENERTPVP